MVSVTSRIATLLAVAWISMCCGCSSTTSTLVTRADDDQLVGSSNGRYGLKCCAKPFKGIPVTMRVPSHVDVSVIETVFFSQSDDGEISLVELPQRHFDVAHEIIYSDKIIAVDPKRPAAGTLEYKATFQHDNPNPRDRQFFSKIDYNIDDQTIKTISALIPSIFPSKPGIQAAPTGAGGETKGTKSYDLITKTRTVAWKRFDLNEPGFETELSAFIAQHVNCSPGCPIPVGEAGCENCVAASAGNTSPVSSQRRNVSEQLTSAPNSRR